MKLTIDKNTFMKSWSVTERIAAQKSTLSVISGVLCVADTTGVTLQATDLKTSLRTTASGITVDQPGQAIFPVKIVGELFKKAPTSIFSVEVTNEGNGTIIAGRNTYRFTTYPVEDFPPLPSAENSQPFCTLQTSELQRILDEGGIAGSVGEEFPKYLGAELIQIKNSECHCVSTDGRRLSLSKSYLDEEREEREMLLPLGSIRELLRILSGIDGKEPICISIDGSLGYFTMDNLEFSIRKIDSSFPNYEKILNPNTTTTLEIDRTQFIDALERIDVVVRDHNKTVILTLSPGGSLKLFGKAPDIGEAKELIDGIIKGESLKVAFNVTFLMGGLKAFHGDQVTLSFNGQEGQMMMLRPNGGDFLYMLMPIKLKSTDLEALDDWEESIN
ncbi:MAG: DNA polymerase III subunit beta [Dethiosulfovibrio peptidovorans]|nr:MAG: DNA polymerase III subunit beta [Dethiosulfovibrio peptidovorans]